MQLAQRQRLFRSSSHSSHSSHSSLLALLVLWHRVCVRRRGVPTLRASSAAAGKRELWPHGGEGWGVGMGGDGQHVMTTCSALYHHAVPRTSHELLPSDILSTRASIESLSTAP